MTQESAPVVESQSQDSADSSVPRNSDNSDIPVVTPTVPQTERSTESVSVTTPTIISLNNSQSSDTTVPIIRFIKTERISPPTVVQTSFQSIAFTSENINEKQNSNEINKTLNSSESQEKSDSKVPVLSRV